MNHPLCGSAIVEAKSKVLDRYSFRPDKKDQDDGTGMSADEKAWLG